MIIKEVNAFENCTSKVGEVCACNCASMESFINYSGDCRQGGCAGPRVCCGGPQKQVSVKEIYAE